MNSVREALEKLMGQLHWCATDQRVVSEDLAPKVEAALRAERLVGYALACNDLGVNANRTLEEVADMPPTAGIEKLAE